MAAHSSPRASQDARRPPECLRAAVTLLRSHLLDLEWHGRHESLERVRDGLLERLRSIALEHIRGAVAREPANAASLEEPRAPERSASAPPTAREFPRVAISGAHLRR